MASPTRFPSGVTNANRNGPFAGMGQLDPTKFHTYFNDFNTYTAADWTVVETQAGATQAIVSGAGGQLALVNSAADDDINAIILVNTGFVLSTSKAFWLKARLKCDNVTESELLFGLQDVMTAFNPANGVYLYKADGEVPVRLSIEKASAVTSSSSASSATGLANDTFVEVAISYVPSDGKVRAWLGDACFATITDLTNLPTVALAPAIGVRNGNAAARTLTVDYIFAAVER